MIRMLPLVLIAAGLLAGAGKAAAAAGDVVDRETLKEFVLEAKSLLEAAQDAAEREAVLESFRTEEWQAGPIYIFITDYEGTGYFHGAKPEREGTNNIDQEDSNGVKVIQQNIAAARAGGGFTEYLWDNPAIEGEDESPKVSYVAPIEIDGVSYYIGAGFYPDTAQTSTAPVSWGSLKERM